MFNSELKREFIKNNPNNNKTIVSVMHKEFDNIGEFEIKFKKDAYDFTKDEVLEYYKSLHTASQERLFVVNSALRIYVQWCVAQGKTETNVFDSISRSDYVHCLDKEKVAFSNPPLK